MNKKRRPYTIILLTIFILISACSNKTKETSEDIQEMDEEQITVFAVSTTLSVEGEIKDYLQLNGDVTAKTTVDTFADTAGKLNKLFIKVGDTVRKDQIIAEVDPSRPGMTFASSPVKASISGTVTQVPIQIGSQIAPSQIIAKISKMDEMEIIIYVPERFISKMRTGLSAIIKTAAYPGEIFTGSIQELSPVVDQISRTMEVKIRLNDMSSKLKAGMFVEVKIITEEKSGIVKLPAEALINRFGEYYVFVLTEDNESNERHIAEKRLVTPGLRMDNQLEILNGLLGGEVVVVRGQTLIENQSMVKIVSTVDPLSVSDEVQ
ncbi:MAG: efflux RND transporter periplasmic adaptor subunit [Spirochaetia bacterium]|jgi:membrane fusion protein (multidrug efflux system)|nr:efflux RND transporter periplasmic adaptor subunit [Spirochaetia bacterium]